MCGLFGFIGTKKQPIDVTPFLALGVENDVRGGHGCGIFVDGQYEYGTVSDKYFSTFFEKSELLKTVDKVEVLIGHDRKASVGGISDEKLQPVVIEDENHQVEFVLMHNGTIINHEELAKKYLSMEKEESSKLSDSQIMARIIYTHGFGVFAEYTGAGVFVMIDYRTPKRKPSVFVFKGESKEYVASTKTTEERPLYYIRTPHGLWFSSIADYLTIMNYKIQNGVYSFPTNTVVLINHSDKLQIVEKIDRTTNHQKEVSITTVTHNPSSYPNYDRYDDYYDDCWWLADDKKVETKTQTPLGLSQVIPIAPNALCSGRIEHDFNTFRYVDVDTKLPLTGKYFINQFGQYQEIEDVSHPFKMFLFNGIPVFGEDALQNIIEYCGINTDCVNFDEMCQYFPEVVFAFTMWPQYDFSASKKFWRYNMAGQRQLYTGKLLVPFGKISDTLVELHQGDLVGRTLHKKCTSQFYKRYSMLCERDYTCQLNALMV